MIRIVSWNINSVRIRLHHIETLVKTWQPHVLCLQETKVEDALFPLEALKAMGFVHVVFSGQKSYNGVAICSRIPLTHVEALEWAGLDHKRHISALLPDGTKVHNFYIPAGGDIPDEIENPAYASKLRFVEEMTAWAEAQKKSEKIIIVGDFNIAPHEHDVWSHKQLLNVVSHTPAETERLNALQTTLNWVDSARHFIPATEKSYSWWSYRNRDWRASNRGRRLDHIWLTPNLREQLLAYHTLPDARDFTLPSDHVPIAVDVDLVF